MMYLPIMENTKNDKGNNLRVRGRATGLKSKGRIYHQQRSKHLAPCSYWQQVQLRMRVHT